MKNNNSKTRANMTGNSKLKTDRLSPKTRTRQGRLLSPLLFNIAVIQLLSCSFEVLEGVVNRTLNYEAFSDVCILSHEGFVDVLMKIVD